MCTKLVIYHVQGRTERTAESDRVSQVNLSQQRRSELLTERRAPIMRWRLKKRVKGTGVEPNTSHGSQ